MRRSLLILAGILVLSLVAVLPAAAITYGVPDGNAHPFVGSMVFRMPGGSLLRGCSGTLIAENVFLTAGHCMTRADAILTNNPGSELLVTFDPAIAESGTFYTGVRHRHPDFGYSGQYGVADPADIAVIVLHQAPGITPAALPTAGLLDQLKDAGTLKDTKFTTVGYGAVRETNRTGFEGILANLDRNRVDQEFLSLTPAWMTMSMNLATGNGGACIGDSGGPHFIHLDGGETNIVASITSTGDSPCKATDKTYRTDTATARDFLAGFVTLP